jgi:ATP-dependent DNA helicase RecQ
MNQNTSIHQILKHNFGFNSFRGQQEEVIQQVLKRKDALVIMPTGGGKSLCYQIPALAMDGLTVVVSPLIALMDDQVAALKLLDIPCGALHSNISDDEYHRISTDIAEGNLKLLYISPERLLSEGFMDYLGRQKINLFAIDEAHCVSVWGNDFRPDYVRLRVLKDRFPEIPLLALTATADASTREDIIKQLGIKTSKPFLSSFERVNIHIECRTGSGRMQQIIKFVQNRPDESGIVYCLSRKSAEKVAESLAAKGFEARAYHAGLNAEKREQVQRDFQNDTIQIVCATIAFGMGIDKPNIRWVIHYNMPKNIEGYYQEIGRGGRDGEEAQALLFYSWGDQINLKKFIDDGHANEEFKMVQSAKLERIWEFATAFNCRTNLILNYFGEYRAEPCGHCDNCLRPPELFEGTRFAQMALSGVVRAKQKVGVNVLIDILRGSHKNEILAWGYDQLKTFGVGAELSYLEWRHYITQMLNQGILSIDYTDHSTLKVTPLSTNVLNGTTNILLGKFEKKEKKAKVKRPSVEIEEIEESDLSLLEKLKEWRSLAAKKRRVPAYVVLHDKALKQLASFKPKSIEDLLEVDGIGEVKLKKYGHAIWEIIQGG